MLIKNSSATIGRVPMITKDDIKKRMADAIRDSGKTYAYIAKAMDVKQSTVVSYAKGKSLPKLKMFAQLCLVLELDVNFILGIDNR